MMRGPSAWSVALRKPDGVIAEVNKPITSVLLRHRWLIVLGAWSYAFYIVHVLVMDLFVRVTGFESTSKREALAATVLVFGRESVGLPRALVEAAGDHALSIPMRDPALRSLNLSTTGALAAYEWARQQRNRSATPAR